MARKLGISHDQVVDTAALIADRDGLPAVSLSGVASAIGVRTPSLYSHVDGLDGLRRELARRAGRLLATRLRAAADEHPRDPAAALRAIGHAYRSFARQHPGQYAALLPAPRPDVDPDGAAAAAASIGVIAPLLTELGIAPELHIDLIRVLRAMLHGFVDLENGSGFGLADPIDPSFERALDAIVELVAFRRPAAHREF